MSIHKNGFWLNTSSDGHFFDKNLSKKIIEILKSEKIKTVVDLGCGKGEYAQQIMQEKIQCDCYDGNPNTELFSNGLCKVIDLTNPINLKYECVISLEVGEHIPNEYEQIFLNNLINSSEKIIILSWAILGQSGRGHVNNRNNDYIEQKFKEKSWIRNKEKENILRKGSTLPWFKNTLMVYEKN